MPNPALQARRTGTSSPLGELFDHGCDAWATVFICGTFYSVFGRDLDGYSISELRMYGILWSIFLSFHLSHWEKYLTGVMYLPWSYDFSMLGGTILYLVTSVAGYQVDHIEVDLSFGIENSMWFSLSDSDCSASTERSRVYLLCVQSMILT